jgi:ATP-binding cassette subfamily C protein CydC
MMSGLRALFAVLRLWRGQAGWLAFGIGVALLSLLAGLALTVAAGQSVFLVKVDGSAPAVALALLAPALLRALGPARVVLRYLERLVTHAAMFRALAGVRVWLFRGVASGAAGGLGWRRSGDLAARLVADVGVLDGLYLRVLVPLAGAVVLLPVLVMMLAGSPMTAAGVLALFLLVAVVLPLGVMRSSLAAGRDAALAGAVLRVTALDLLAGLREVRAFGAEERMQDAAGTAEAALMAVQLRGARAAAWADAMALAISQLAVLLTLLAMGGTTGPGLCALLLVLTSFEAAAVLPRAGVAAGLAAAAAERVVAEGAASSPYPDPTAIPDALPRGSALRFEGVRFGWRRDRSPVLDGLTLELPPGCRAALLGPSGAGKSTLAALALRLVHPGAGRVMLGGVDLATLPGREVHQRVALLSQATHLFDDTIRANLLVSRPAATDAELWDVLSQATLADTVRAFPDGLETWVGEGGARLSGGQARRLALARTLLQRASVLILDEPASGLDPDAERAFLELLNVSAPGQSVLLIAHRLTGVERLDRIWRLSGGHAVPATA